jgi:hypothetical protein
MSQPITATATRPPALRDRDDTDQVDRRAERRRAERRRARRWTLVEALAYAGAYVDPSGILAVQRIRRAQEEEAAARRARR